MFVIDGVSYKFLLFLFGVVCEGKLLVIGNGVVLDFYVLVEEVEWLSVQGVVVMLESFCVVENVILILLLYWELDVLWESFNIGIWIGMMKWGIGFVYEDKVGWCVICLMDLKNLMIFLVKIDRLLIYYNVLCWGFGQDEILVQVIYEELISVVDKVLFYMDKVWYFLDEQCWQGKWILFEGV